MTEAELITSMRAPGSRSRTDRKLRPFYAVLPIILALAVGSSAHAGEGKWTLQLEPMYMEASGHDQHVLTIREIDFAAARAMIAHDITVKRIQRQQCSTTTRWGSVNWISLKLTIPRERNARGAPLA
jgi:hypothetical protein